MKLRILHVFFCCIGLLLNAQEEFHVFPKDHTSNPGTENGTGAIDNPWDLQTAFDQKSDVVNAGDIIWLHDGIYNGRFTSSLQSLESDKYITVSAYKTDKVILNGNVTSSKKAVLEVKGKQVIYKNFEVTFLGEFTRNKGSEGFKNVDGITHSNGIDCKFINLKIHNNPGSGFGSWKRTGGTEILDCLIFNNGYTTSKNRGGGVGIYVQNNSESTRIIENNIIFNNFYKGVQIWSANKKAKEEFVKNIILKSNVIFNNGSPSGAFKDNLIVASDDRNGTNIAKHIKILNNIFYHNTDVGNAQVGGDAASLTLGFHKNAPIENVEIKNNMIIGRNNGLRILHAKSLTFENNSVYCGYVHMQSSVLEHMSQWQFKNNTYFTKKSSSFRILKHQDYDLNKWQSNFGIDRNSQWKHIKQFDLKTMATITRYKYRKDAFKVVILQKDGEPTMADFSKAGLKTGINYTIYDVENVSKVLKTGTLSEDFKITFPMQLTAFEKPLHNTKAKKSLSNFGVFIIEFKPQGTEDNSVEKKEGVIKRFFKWLGF
ncbi:hypothetical protein [uncultured Psychroserpens sp.]|uniref:hypothetical protein n=1 Tax=uncultured Psychroserpens sp. TaxID=255436 RepID=UPI00261E8923|nr:hypothetical protein [uncultured Psychroserpens sp.]